MSLNMIDHQLFNEYLAIMLVEKRVDLGLTRSELAHYIKISEYDLEQIESGEFTSVLDRGILSELMEAYKLSENEIRSLYKIASVTSLIRMMKVLDESHAD